MKKRFISLTLVLSMIMSLFVVMPHTAGAADGDVPSDMTNPIIINSADDLIEFVNKANSAVGHPYLSRHVLLNADIDVSTYNAQLRIGDYNSNNAYTGIFDGGGHKITGLRYEGSITNNAGLFAYTNGATIRNLVIEDADIMSARYGGIVVGIAEDTNIQNVSVRNSTIEMYTLGAVIDLITFGGISGGIVAGVIEKNSIIYNCEAVDSHIKINTTAGVQAAGGNSLYLGGLAGGVQDSTIEYSRVIGGSVRNEWDVAINALGGQVVYSGGIAGYISGNTSIIDCFATPEVYFYGATYVSVGAGTDGRTGGIVAHADGETFKIERCHFAGSLHSRLYNAVLIIPIIMDDYYLYGVLGANDGVSNNNVINSYYHWENARAVLKDEDADMSAVRGSSDTGTYGALGKDQYTNQAAWSANNYDFTGTIGRTTGSDSLVGANHHNRWVMDYVTGMPVHGKGVTAATDFPGAGMVTIGAEGYRDAVSTDSGNVTQITDANDTTVTLSATANPGYNFEGWYKGQINNDGTVSITGEEPLTKDTTYNASADDNAVYVAHYTANINFTVVGGNTVIATINHSYNEPLKFADAKAEEGQQFYGWTRDKNKSKTEATQNDINATTFVAAGTPVTETMTLYPVYIGVSANIHAVFEATGTDTLVIDATENSTMNTVIESDDTGWYVTFNFGSSEAAVPEGYMFDGWYRKDYSQSETGSTVSLDDAVCVSRDEKYYIDEDEIIKSNLYVAKFKYKVTAWIPVKIDEAKFRYDNENRENNDGKYTEIYVDYNTNASELNLGTPNLGQKAAVRHWTAEKPEDKTYDGGDLNNLNLKPFTGVVTAPLDLYAMVSRESDGGYQPGWTTAFIYYTDFPGSSTISMNYNSGGWTDSAEFTIGMNENYNFVGVWHYDSDGHSEDDSTNISLGKTNPATWTISNSGGIISPSFSSYVQEYMLLKASANVNFYSAKGEKRIGQTLEYSNPAGWDQTPTATRKYQSLLFGNAEPEAILTRLETRNIAELDYPVGIGGTYGMEKVPNYKWLGWVDINQLRDVDKTHLFDYEPAEGVIEDVQYITTDSRKALGYVLNDEDRVYAPMELYPLYAKYKVNITTNIDDAELGENAPDAPSYVVDQDGNITITVPSDEGFTLEEITLTDEDGNEITLMPGENGTYTGSGIDVDKTYTVDVEYGYNVTVTYHKNGSSDTYADTKNGGETLGGSVDTILPTITDIEGMVFIGWTAPESAPDNGYVVYDKSSDTIDMLVTSNTVVTRDMDLYPVYVAVNHSSNIDTDNDKKTSLQDSKLEAEQVVGYEFSGWYAITHDSESQEVQTLVATAYEYNVSKENALAAEEFKAVYKPIVTYMIPVKGDDGALMVNYTPYTESVELGHQISNGTEGISDAANYQVAQVIGDTYELTGWRLQNDTTAYTGSVSGPITLYPILKEITSAAAVTFNYYLTDETEPQSTQVHRVQGSQITLPQAPNYTDAGGTTYYFTHWVIEGDESGTQYLSGTQYTVNGDVTFIARYTDTAFSDSYTVYSNWNDKAVSVTLDSDGSLPNENNSALDTLEPESKEEGITFIGYALVDIGENDTRTNSGLYAEDYRIDRAALETYGGTDFEPNTHRIYAVWAQIDTATGASLRLSDDDINGMRVMGYVNTEVLERVGLNIPDEDYKRGMDFSNKTDFDATSPFIIADSEKWHGNNYRTMFESGFSSVEGINAFSIIAQLGQSDYNTDLSFRAWLEFKYVDDKTKKAYGTFNADANKRTISNIASSYIKTLRSQNNNANASQGNNWYGLGETAYNKLEEYAGSTS